MNGSTVGRQQVINDSTATKKGRGTVADFIASLSANKIQPDVVESFLEGDDLLTESEVVEKYKFSSAWFQKKRWKGGGPPYIKVHKAVRYPARTTAIYFASFGLQKSTAEGV